LRRRLRLGKRERCLVKGLLCAPAAATGSAAGCAAAAATNAAGAAAPGLTMSTLVQALAAERQRAEAAEGRQAALLRGLDEMGARLAEVRYSRGQ
jgi:hypothetical protein